MKDRPGKALWRRQPSQPSVMNMDAKNSWSSGMPASVLKALRALRGEVIQKSNELRRSWNVPPDNGSDALINLSHYMAIRTIDLRSLQRQLMSLGLSSLGRLESRVLPTLDAVVNALCGMTGDFCEFEGPTMDAFFAGEARLALAADELFGPPPANRHTRIMVTLPGEASADPALLADLARCGMDVARINCAHDDASVWRLLAKQLRDAGEKSGRPITINIDIAGPKIRTKEVAHADHAGKLQAGDSFRLVRGVPHVPHDAAFAASLSLPGIVQRLSVGDRVSYDDGKLEGYVEKTAAGEALVRVVRSHAEGVKLKPEKGINLPDTELGLSPLTAKDQSDLATVLECGDIIGYSFVRRPDDIDLLERAVAQAGADGRRPGLIAKIERPEAVKNLPALIARAVPHWRFGVMIARGDLAAEIGFERLAEMQEEILWICEAASVPVVWATQVLEDLVKEGLPSRGEMTDAAMAVRAECVMLNKGPAICEGVSTLDRLLTRMEGHMLKKTPILRALKTWS
jgi:pyruvate kinase